MLLEKDDWVTRTDIRQHFRNNKSSSAIGSALQLLERQDMAESRKVLTGGRPAEQWRAKRLHHSQEAA